ncbi:hypothetical protein NSQ76_20665 [Bacillus sp. FSL M8-0256]|uniref:hypothetical protein n=1 Tax=Bacillus TaxID=1386 RepID=UPI0013B8F85B|nr:hypothetical protein [Bacillus subtilis]KAF2423345.1 hypothetical protein B6K89_16100 [Bacillus subtilis]MEC0312086.1 hypothetical protein [Bacillus subtilis]MEC0363699.1 hypothetical protein [Bacillus subtilis]
MEQNVASLQNMVLTGLLLMAIIAIAGAIVPFTQAIEFKSYVTTQIERNGGLTAEAKENIDEYNQAHYQGRYQVSSNSEGQKKKFGESVDYTIKGNVHFDFFNLPPIPIGVKGSAVSLVR